MLKKLLIAVGVVVVLVVIALVAAVLWIDALARRGVEYGASSALGVPTQLQAMDVGLLSGSVGMGGLQVANPQGFAAPHFLVLRDGHVQVSLGSLRQEVVEIPTLRLSGLEVHLQKNKEGKANYDLILANLKKNEQTHKDPAPAGKQGKKFVIHELVIEDITVHAEVVSLAGVVKPAPVKIDRIVLNNVGTAGNMDSSQVTGVMLKSTLASAVALGRGILPNEIVSGLGDGLEGLSSLAADGVKVAGELGHAIGSVGKGAAEAAGQLGQELEKGLGGVGKGLGELFGGKKEDK